MYECSICGKLNFYSHCKDCFERYQEDLRTGHIPPQFKEAEVDFTYEDWRAIKNGERSFASRHSPEDARALVEDTILKRISLHRGTSATPEQLKKAADERIKKYSTY